MVDRFYEKLFLTQNMIRSVIVCFEATTIRKNKKQLILILIDNWDRTQNMQSEPLHITWRQAGEL